MTSTLAEPRKSTLSSVADDPRWARVVARDKTADGHLWYSVLTTGVYCRPSCPSRLAKPKNVQLYDTLESAKATGFRPCKRCNPDGPSIEAENAAVVAKACRIMEESEEEEQQTGAGRASTACTTHASLRRMYEPPPGTTHNDPAPLPRGTRVGQGRPRRRNITEAIYGAGFKSREQWKEHPYKSPSHV